MEILQDLNENQRQVVTTTEGPLLVLAGAGSGKTRSVIYRAAYLINQKKIPPWNLLIVTFTNKAARELLERLELKFKIPTRSLWIGTFHSVCARILRAESDFLPVTSSFSIYDDYDQKNLMKKVLKTLEIDTKTYPLSKVRYLISRQKNSLIRPQDFFLFNENNVYTESISKIYDLYQKNIIKNNAFDFDDLLLYTAHLLKHKPDILKKYEKKFLYIMIDEYQDTNYAQFKIVNQLARNHQNLCVVGDDDQAIYSWRGADIKNILNFRNDYNQVTTIKLEKNYRSPDKILGLANSLIRNNADRHEKELWTDKQTLILPELIRAENENDEAKKVLKRINRIKRKGGIFKECVILYRTNAQSRAFERAFSLQGMKYKIIGGVNFYQRKEIKDLIAYLRILVNDQDNESLLRIINFPARGAGKITINWLLQEAVNRNLSLLNTLMSIKDEDKKTQGKKSLLALSGLIAKWKKLTVTTPLTGIIKKIITDTGISDLYKDSEDPKDQSRLENINEFISAADEFQQLYFEEFEKNPVLDEYLQNLSLQTDLDTVDEEADAVNLMTMHNAKGLEFDHVFIVGLEEGLLPHSRSMESNKEIEEERRLLYVAITRAKESVNLFYAQSRRFQEVINMTLPSRFISELDSKFYTRDTASYYVIGAPGKYKKKKKVPKILENEKYYKIGQKIAHSKFGEGVILNVEGKGSDAKLTISFQRGVLKKIIGSYVKKL